MRPSDVWVDASNVDKADVRKVLSSLVAGAKAYGAVGDGVTDDQAALSSLASSNPGAIHFPAGTYRLASSLAITAPCFFDKGAILAPDSGAGIQFDHGPIAGRWQIFGGDGTVEIIEACVAFPEWWGNDADAIQRCIAATFRGTRIEFAGKYITNGIDLDFPRDDSKALVGVGGPAKKFQDVSIGAAIYLADGADADVINISGTAGDRAHVVIDNLMLNGNKGNQTKGHGLTVVEAKDVRIGWLYIRNCKENGFNVPAGAGVNQIFVTGGIDVNGCDGVGHFLNGLADSYLNALIAGSNGSHGVQHSNGNVQYNIVRTFQNGGHGVNIVGNSGQFTSIKSNHNGQAGIHVNANNVQIGMAHCYDNGRGTDGTGAGVADNLRAAVRFGGSAADVHIGVLRTTGTSGSETQIYHIRDDANGNDIWVGRWMYDANYVTDSIRINDTSLSHYFGAPKLQSVNYTASLDIDPYKGEHVKVGTLTGDITINNIPSTKRANGLTITIELLQDGTGGRTISWGNAWVLSTTPSTNANERTILTFRASGGVMYEIAGVTGMA